MKALWRKASRVWHTPRTLAAVAVVLLLAAPAFAQGTSPWENAVQRPSNGFHQHHRTRPVTGRDCGGGPDVRFRRRRIEAHSRGRAVRRWHGNRGGELPRVAFSGLLTHGETWRSTWQTQDGSTESIGRCLGHSRSSEPSGSFFSSPCASGRPRSTCWRVCSGES